MVRGFELKIFARNRSQSVSRLSECFRNRLNTQERSFWIKEEKTLVRAVYRQEKRKNKKKVPDDMKMLKLKQIYQTDCPRVSSLRETRSCENFTRIFCFEQVIGHGKHAFGRNCLQVR